MPNGKNDFDEDEIDLHVTSEVSDLFERIRDMGDLYFVVLLILSKMENSSKYSVLAELAYLLDKQSFMNLLWYYEGQTIRIPTRAELSDALNMMSIYYHYQILGKPWKTSLIEVGYPDDRRLHSRIWTKYKKFLKDLENVKLPQLLKVSQESSDQDEETAYE